MAKVPVSFDEEGMPVILEQPDDDEPRTNLPGVFLGLAAAPFVVVLATLYVRLMWCLVVYIWRWASF